jgi:hypothetical protein
MRISRRKRKHENVLVNIVVNIAVPAIIMVKFDEWLNISPALALVLALMFPLGYGIFDLIRARKWSLFSAVGFFSILITGGIGLLQLPCGWIAIKEASVPIIFFILIVLSALSKRTMLEKFLFDGNILNADLIYSHIRTDDQRIEFRRIMLRGTALLASSFILSAILNFALARAIVHSESGSTAFTKELGNMVAMSYPIIVIPCTLVLYVMLHYVVKKLKHLTKLSTNELLDLE